jgi:hypothetical protein
MIPLLPHPNQESFGSDNGSKSWIYKLPYEEVANPQPFRLSRSGVLVVTVGFKVPPN